MLLVAPGAPTLECNDLLNKVTGDACTPGALNGGNRKAELRIIYERISGRGRAHNMIRKQTT